MKLLKQVGGAILVIFILIVWIGIGNFFAPVGLLSQIQNGYWGGYIQDTSGKVWILVDFEKNDNERTMTVLAKRSYTGVYNVKLGSGDENFAEYTMQGTTSPNLTVQAKQLYVGKRYVFQRLMVGRFSDFWKRNSDDAIRGKLKNEQSTSEFAIERLHDEDVPFFFEENISPDNQELSLDQISSLFALVHP